MASNANDDEEDDYMTMALPAAAPPTRETNLQRLRRERLAAAERGRVKSKAQLEAEAAEARDRALSRSLLDDPAVTKRSKGFAMMARMGFKKGDALGRREGDDKKKEEMGTESGVEKVRKGEEEGEGEEKRKQKQKEDDSPPPPRVQQARDDNDNNNNKEPNRPRTEPIKITIKTDRGGIGLSTEREKKRKLQEEEANMMDEAEKRARRPDTTDPLAYRDRVARERENARREKQVRAAQRLAEQLYEQGHDDEDDDGGGGGGGGGGGDTAKRRKPLKRTNVLWRGMVRARETSDRDARIHRAAEADLTARGPRYVPTDDEEDEYDRLALGRDPTSTSTILNSAPGDEELDEEDEELDAFEALEPGERLGMLVRWLRVERRYCFWCGCGYEDEEMDGCPGETEDDHD